jgi:pimeloyl-ACP methyl ester carboxylesterase
MLHVRVSYDFVYLAGGASFKPLKQIDAGVLNIGYAEDGPADITMEGDANGAAHAPDASAYRNRFSGKYASRIITGGIGHNLPQEAPKEFAQAIIDVDGLGRTS